MDYIERVFDRACELPPPQTRKYRDASRRECDLLEAVETAMGKDFAESLRDVEADLFFINGRHFFLHGLRFGLEFLKL